MTTRKRQQGADQADRNRTRPYRELAANHVELKRQIDAAQLPRLSELGTLHGPVETMFRFCMMERRPAVAASASAMIALPCQWCGEGRQRRICIAFEALLAEDELQARSWGEEDDPELPVAAVVGVQFDAAALVEDELMLAVPGRVCVDAQCAQTRRILGVIRQATCWCTPTPLAPSPTRACTLTMGVQ